MVGDSHACGRTAGNQVYCWGFGGQGQLGNGGSGDLSTPTLVSGGQSWAQVGTGGLLSCGIVTTSSAGYCWGDNSGGALGNGTTNSSPTPVPISASQAWATISPGFDFTCGRTTATTGSNGFCWGWNDQGQLGLNNTSTNATIPSAVAGGFTWSSIMASRNRSACGVTAAGVGYCWGQNFYGQLGDGTFTLRIAPTAVNTGVAFATTQGSLVAGDLHTCGFTTGGSGFCWGNNENGELGNNTRTVRLTPTSVITGPASVAPILVDTRGGDLLPDRPSFGRYRQGRASVKVQR